MFFFLYIIIQFTYSVIFLPSTGYTKRFISFINIINDVKYNIITSIILTYPKYTSYLLYISSRPRLRDLYFEVSDASWPKCKSSYPQRSRRGSRTLQTWDLADLWKSYTALFTHSRIPLGAVVAPGL